MESNTKATPTKKLARVEVSVEQRHVEQWKRAAKESGLNLSNWMRLNLIAAAKQQRAK